MKVPSLGLKVIASPGALSVFLRNQVRLVVRISALFIVSLLPIAANAQALQDGWYYVDSQEFADSIVFNFLELKESSESRFRMIGISVPHARQGGSNYKQFMPMTHHQVDCRQKKTRMYMADLGFIGATDVNVPSNPVTFPESEHPWQNIPEGHIPYNFICEGNLLLSNDRYAGGDLQAIFNRVINSAAKP